MEYSSNMKALFIIFNAGFAEEVIEIAREEGARGATVLNARGEGSRHESFMGITVDSEKEMILCITDENTSEKIMAAIKVKVGIKTPARSVCFTLPVEKTIGIEMSASQTEE